MNRTLIVIALTLLLVPSFAMAGDWTGSDIDLSGTIGTGSNASYLIVDFNSTSYAFKYLWDAPQDVTLKGADLILALSDDATGIPGLNVGYDVWPGMGMSVNTMSYDENAGVGNWPTAWWNYWTGSVGGVQRYSGEGCSDREIANGSIDSWVFTGNENQAPNIPGVPEPSSLLALCSLIGLVGSTKLLRGRRK